MGYDISILYSSKKNNFWEIAFRLSYNHSENLKAVGFYPRDFNGKTMREVLLALNTAINKMLTDGVSPLEMIRDMESFQKHSGLYSTEKIEAAFYEAKMENLLAILMRIREQIERKCAKELDVLYWHSD